MFKSRDFIISFVVFIVINVLLYVFIFFFHNLLPFNDYNYTENAHHFIEDPRINGEKFDFLKSLGVWDAQWYLKNARDGYVQNPQSYEDKTNSLEYAFFPLYPSILRLLNLPFNNLPLTSFVLANILLIINFLSLYYVISKLYTQRLALKAIFLIFLFPLSIFFRSYFTEGLYLFFLIWFSYFLTKKEFLISGVFLALLSVTKGNGLLLYLLFFYYLIRERHRQKEWYLWLCVLLSVIPFLSMLYFNYQNTKDFLYMLTVRRMWFNSPSPLDTLLDNLRTISLFFALPFHGFHASKVDAAMVVLTGFLIYKSRRFLIKSLWWICLIFFVTHLVVQDLMSFSRNMIIFFPLAIYVAHILEDKYYALLCVFMLGLLFVTGIYFVNWYWIG